MNQNPLPTHSPNVDPRLDGLKHWLQSLAHTHGLTLDLSTLAAASSDAGFRRYFRLSTVADLPATLIAMDAPPPEKTREFVQIQKLLNDAGVQVPHIWAVDVENGYMLLADMGTTAYIDVLRADDEESAKPLLRSALESLIHWQLASQPGILPDYDAAFLRREMDLFPEWYIGKHLGVTLDAKEQAALDEVFTRLTDSALAQPRLFVHRDFMPRNLMVHAPAPAVLDFQDALMGPATYDVASLLRDAFISWDESFQLDCIAWYWGKAKAAGLPVGEDFAEYYRALEWMGLQRHLKILGLFARLNYRDGKPRYLADTPRFIAYARKVSGRYSELSSLWRLLNKLENTVENVGYTF